MQKHFQLYKYYLVEVYGDMKDWGSITRPLAHHRYNPDRMVAIKADSDRHKAK